MDSDKKANAQTIKQPIKLSRRNLVLTLAVTVAIGISGYLLALTLAAADTPAIPGQVAARTGGNSIGLIWNASTGPSVKNYEVFRDGVKVATLTPGVGETTEDKTARTFMDKTVVAGTTYKYQVRAVGANDGASELSAAVSATHPRSTTPVPTIAFDTTAAPEVRDFLVNNIQPEIEAWFPKLSDAVAYPDYTPGTSFKIFIDTSLNGTGDVANYDKNQVNVKQEWIKDPNHQKDSLGMFMHELTHHINSGDTSQNAKWYTESVADWTREYFMRERAPRAPAENITPYPGYSDGSYFLNWIQEKYDNQFIRKVMIAKHKNTYRGDFYSADFTRKTTGRSISQLWKEMRGNLISDDYTEIRGIANRCLDTSENAGTQLQLLDCNGQWQQKWVFTYDKGSTNTGVLKSDWGGLCLDVAGGGKTNGTKVQAAACTGGVAQRWVAQQDGSLRNPNANKCLETEGGRSDNNTKTVIWDCNNGVWQKWQAPLFTGSAIGIGNKCVDVDSFNTTNGTRLILWDCVGNKAQDWAPMPVQGKANTYAMRALGKCMDVSGVGTADGTAVVLWECVGNVAQEWVPQTNGGLKNPNSGKCLQTVGSSSAGAAKLEIRTCNGGAAQNWFTALSTPAGTPPTPAPTPAATATATPTPTSSSTPAPTATPIPSPSSSPSASPSPSLTAPTGLKVYTGGPSIALNWNPSTGITVKEYNVYRNDVKIGTTKPDTAAIDSKRRGAYFTDKTVTAGTTYRYQVQVVNSAGQTSPLTTAVTVTQPTAANTTGIPSITINAPSGYEDLGEWARTVAVPELEVWYPKLADSLARGSYTPFSSMTIKFDPNFAGNANVIAFVGGTGSNNQTMTMGIDHFRNNKGDIGPAIHESVHIVQDNKYYYTDRAPKWIAEGVARSQGEVYFNRTHDLAAPLPHQLYTDAYSVAAYFMKWMENTYKLPTLLRDLNTSMYANTYDDNSFFQAKTGKSAPQLWKEMTGRDSSSVGAIHGVNNYCIENANYTVADGNPVQVGPCNSHRNQEWVFHYDKASTTLGELHLNGERRCLDVNGSGTVSGTKVHIWNCNGGVAQKWQKRTDGSWLNPNSNKCLDADTPQSPTKTGARLQIWDCNGLAHQKWSGVVATGQLVHSSSSKCVDDYNFGTANGNALNLFGCVGNAAQQFHFLKKAGSSSGSYRVLSKCMEVANLAKANNTPVQIWDCNGQAQQEWTPQTNGSLKNTFSGRCLQPQNGATANNTRMVIFDCNGSATQRITTPVYSP